MITIKTINIEGMIIKDSAKETYNNAKIKTTSVSEVTSQLTGNEDIKIIANSIGGDVFAGNEIYTALKKYPGKIEAEVIFAASIATVIVMAADKIIMSPTGQFMIHNVSTKVEGDYRDMEKSAQTLKNMNAMIASSYKQRFKLSDEDLSKMMDDETWLNAEQAKEVGFVDEIMFENKSKSYVACFSNDMSFEGGDKVEEKEVVLKEDFETFKKEMLGILEAKFKNADDNSEEARLVRRIEQLEKLKEDGNALSDSERVELIDDLLQLVRDNRQQSQSNNNDSNDVNNKQEEEFENKTKKLGLFL